MSNTASKLGLVVLLITMLGVGYGLSHYNVVSVGDSEDTFVQPVVDQPTTQVNETNSGNPVSGKILNGTVTLYGTQSEELRSVGTGFQYTDTHIMTNQHVAENQQTMYVKYSETDWREAEVVGTDVHSDIAILEVTDVPDYVDPLPLQSELPESGEDVIAVGSPSGLDDSVSTGVVSSTERSVRIQTPFAVPDSIQTDAALNPGNSGGPLIDSDTGAVVGVNRATDGENIGYAVSARVADRVGKSLIDDGTHGQPYIGISTLQLNPLTEEEYDYPESIDGGLIVAETINGTPGGESFIGGENGTPDLIKAIGDEETKDNEDLASYLLRKVSPGDTVEFTVLRDGEETTVNVTMSSREEADVSS